jgi:hypothetical protein
MSSMSGATWQPNYEDLSEPGTMCLGARCVICGARYMTPIETLDPQLVALALPGSPMQQEIADLRYRFFEEFDAAYREISINCFRCGRTACPDCWDEDHRMCGECVVSRGLTRSPHRGRASKGPLGDGRLQRSAAGRYSEVGRPGWLNHLLEAQATYLGRGTARGAAQVSAVEAAPPAPAEIPDVPTAPLVDDGARSYPAVAFSPAQLDAVAAAPTIRHSITPVPVSPRPDGGQPRPGFLERAGEFETPEGKATSNMVTCPRCGAENYDFVTRCTSCQLQLIQICPLCEKLNSGQASHCEHCGSPLDRPRGWAELPANAPAPAEREQPPRKERRSRRPVPRPPAALPAPSAPMSPAGLPTSAVALGPAVPAPGLFEMQPPTAPEDEVGTAWMILGATERVASAVLLLVILLLVGAVAAAELSTRADAFLRSLLHVDVRAMLAHFIAQVQLVIQRLRR